MAWQSPLIPPGEGGGSYSVPLSPFTGQTAELTINDEKEGGREGGEEVTYFDLLPPEVEGEECDPVVQQRVVDYMAQWTAAALEKEEGREERGERGRGRKRRREGGGGRGGFTANLKEKKDFGNPELLQRVGREGGMEGGRPGRREDCVFVSSDEVLERTH